MGPKRAEGKAASNNRSSVAAHASKTTRLIPLRDTNWNMPQIARHGKRVPV
jgi:hypothetical protein